MSVYEIESGVLVHIFETGSPITSIAFSPQGNIVAAGREDGGISVLSIQYLDFVANLSEHTKPVNDIEFSPDGALIASSQSFYSYGQGADTKIVLWGMTGWEWNFQCTRDADCQPDEFCNLYLHRCVANQCKNEEDDDRDGLQDGADPDCQIGNIEIVID